MSIWLLLLVSLSLNMMMLLLLATISGDTGGYAGAPFAVCLSRFSRDATLGKQEAQAEG